MPPQKKVVGWGFISLMKELCQWRVESTLKMKKQENITNVRSLFGSVNQFIRFIPKLPATTEPTRGLRNNVHDANGGCKYYSACKNEKKIATSLKTIS